MISYIKSDVFRLPCFPFVKQNRRTGSHDTSFPLLTFFATRIDNLISISPERKNKERSRMSVGERATVDVGNTISDTVGSVLEAFYSRLLVCINVELDKQEQVAGQDTTSKQGSSLGASAVSYVRHIPCRRITRVGYKSS